MMEYKDLVKAYGRIESTTKRLEMTDYLVDLFKITPPDIIDKVIYLTQGKLYPDFIGIELGLAEKLVINALKFTSGISEKTLKQWLVDKGDLGLVSMDAIKNKKQRSLFVETLTVEKVYKNFETIAKSAGSGSQDLKIKLLAELLHDSTPEEAKYIVRTVIGKLRLGIADMTIIDALALAFAEKRKRAEIERAYDVCSDLGLVAKVLCTSGLESLKSMKPKVGIPLRAMLAERLSSVSEIFEKMAGKCAFEYKYDGLRIQAHIDAEKVQLFSRRLENVTSQFPDICDELKKAFKAKDGILEGECVPVDPNTGDLLPFQEVSHRRGRKYGIQEAIQQYPVHLFLFDCLYVNGIDMTHDDYLTRRNKLAEIIIPTDAVKLSDLMVTDKSEDVENFFAKSISAGCEGVIAKSIGKDSVYKAGARGWQWIKYKREYVSEMIDTVDLVVVGAFAGHGRRAGTYGALLMAAYNSDTGMYETVCKLGSGFDDATLANLPDMLKNYRVKNKPKNVKSNLDVDFWFSPEIVLEVVGAELTLSPVHTCAYGVLSENAGLAIRFPRFTGRWRTDKKADDSTKITELIEMYKRQLKKVE